MATTKQRKALDKIVENRGNVSRAMIDVGYNLATAKNPKNLTESIGFRELCEEQGLTDKLLLKALVADIKAKPKNRKAELELGFKVKGRMAEDEQPKAATVINLNFIGFGNNAKPKHRPNAQAEGGLEQVA